MSYLIPKGVRKLLVSNNQSVILHALTVPIAPISGVILNRSKYVLCCVLGVTGGLAAPLVAAGAGAVLGAGGAAVLGSATGIAIMASLFGAAGAGLTGELM